MVYGVLRNKIEVKIPQETRILTITVEDTDGDKAAELANSVRDEAFEEIKEITKEDSVNILEKAQPSKTPSSPDIKKNTIMAVGLRSTFNTCNTCIKRSIR